MPGGDAVWTKLNYLHNNPVKNGLIELPEDSPWSSARQYLGGKEDGIVNVVVYLGGN